MSIYGRKYSISGSQFLSLPTAISDTSVQFYSDTAISDQNLLIAIVRSVNNKHKF